MTDKLPTDTEILDWLSLRSTRAMAGWVARESIAGRGFRVWEATQFEAANWNLSPKPTIREAVIDAMERDGK